MKPEKAGKEKVMQPPISGAMLVALALDDDGSGDKNGILKKFFHSKKQANKNV